MRLMVIPIGTERWSASDMSLAVEQARDSVRRIRKKIDVRRERVRYSLACDRIEKMAMQYCATEGPIFEVEGEEAQFVLNNLPSDGEARLPFFDPSEGKKIWSYLRRKISVNGGIVGGLVVVLNAFRNIYSPPDAGEAATASITDAETEIDYSSCEVSLDSLSDDVLRRTHDQIRRAIEKGEPMGWINVESYVGLARHTAIVTALREYIGLKERPSTTRLVKVPKQVPDEEAIAIREAKWWYKLLKDHLPFLLPKSVPMKTIMVDEERLEYLPIEPVYIRIAYRDGSEGAPFPLFCLPPIEKPTGLPTIRSALISDRHFDLDSRVDVCLLRNSEVSRREDSSIAEQEQLAFDRATQFIQSFIGRFKGLELHLYHTGLEPAVVGTYRAIVEALHSSDLRGRFLVVPKVYHGNHSYVDLKPWY